MNKISLFSVPIDFSCQFDTELIYPDSWSKEYILLQKRTHRRANPVMKVITGGSFSLAVTKDQKIYSWGLNDYNQLGRRTLEGGRLHSGSHNNKPNHSKILEGIKPRILTCGDDHSLLVDANNDLYTWGGSENGQLGFSCPKKLTKNIFKKNLFEGKVRTAAACGKDSYVITTDGDVYKWPNEKNQESRSAPLRLEVHHVTFNTRADLSPKSRIEFKHISCGFRFAIGVSSLGKAYGVGINSNGQLGIGVAPDDMYYTRQFIVLKAFEKLKEKVLEISCGFSHSICKTSTGKVFVWGSGGKGQLGRVRKAYEIEPILVNPYREKRRSYKALSVQAGFEASYILNEDRRVYFSGNGGWGKGPKFGFRLLNFEEKVRELLTPKGFGLF